MASRAFSGERYQGPGRVASGDSRLGEPQADGRRDLELLSGTGQATRALVAREDDHVARALIRDEQPSPRRIECEVARPGALGGRHLVERETAALLVDRERRDAVVAAIRDVEGSSRRGDVHVRDLVATAP